MMTAWWCPSIEPCLKTNIESIIGSSSFLFMEMFGSNIRAKLAGEPNQKAHCMIPTFNASRQQLYQKGNIQVLWKYSHDVFRHLFLLCICFQPGQQKRCIAQREVCNALLGFGSCSNNFNKVYDFFNLCTWPISYVLPVKDMFSLRCHLKCFTHIICLCKHVVC